MCLYNKFVFIYIKYIFHDKYNDNDDITLTTTPPNSPTSPNNAPTVLKGWPAPLSVKFHRKKILPMKKTNPNDADATGYYKPPININPIIEAITST